MSERSARDSSAKPGPLMRTSKRDSPARGRTNSFSIVTSERGGCQRLRDLDDEAPRARVPRERLSAAAGARTRNLRRPASPRPIERGARAGQQRVGAAESRGTQNDGARYDYAADAAPAAPSLAATRALEVDAVERRAPSTGWTPGVVARAEATRLSRRAGVGAADGAAVRRERSRPRLRLPEERRRVSAPSPLERRRRSRGDVGLSGPARCASVESSRETRAPADEVGGSAGEAREAKRRRKASRSPRITSTSEGRAPGGDDGGAGARAVGGGEQGGRGSGGVRPRLRQEASREPAEEEAAAATSALNASAARAAEAGAIRGWRRRRRREAPNGGGGLDR